MFNKHTAFHIGKISLFAISRKVKSFEFEEDKVTLTFSEKYPIRMSFRRPPSDVDRMTSLRVDNLPYSAVMEVSELFNVFVLNAFVPSVKAILMGFFVSGPAASV